MNYREVGLSSSRRFTRSHIVLLTASALSRTLFSTQFLVPFLRNGGDHGLRVRVISNYCCGSTALMFCLLVIS